MSYCLIEALTKSGVHTNDVYYKKKLIFSRSEISEPLKNMRYAE